MPDVCLWTNGFVKLISILNLYFWTAYSVIRNSEIWFMGITTSKMDSLTSMCRKRSEKLIKKTVCVCQRMMLFVLNKE
jgi:hypothetical protein